MAKPENKEDNIQTRDNAVTNRRNDALLWPPRNEKKLVCLGEEKRILFALAILSLPISDPM